MSVEQQPRGPFERIAIDRDVAPLLRRVATFHPALRPEIAELISRSAVFDDLVETFPALLVALACGYATSEQRAQAQALLMSGGNLKAAAAAIGLPLWTRKLPPAAFAEPLVAVPGDGDAALRLANLVPIDATCTADWLKAVSEAYLSGGRDYALWMARHGQVLTRGVVEPQRLLFNAWVFASGRPDVLAHRYVRTPWSPGLGIKRVLEEFGAWQQRMALAEWLADGSLKPWIDDGEIDGLTFTTLRTAEDFVETAAALDNCLEQYGERLRNGLSNVAAVRRNGKVVAAIEVGPHGSEASVPTIVQLRGMRNRRAGIEVWLAAYAWIATRAGDPVRGLRLRPAAEAQARIFDLLWQPYLAALAAQGASPVMLSRARRMVQSRQLAPSARMTAARSQTVVVAENPQRVAALRELRSLQENVRSRLAGYLPRVGSRR